MPSLRVGSLITLDLKWDDSRLVADVQRFQPKPESPKSAQLEVVWSATPRASDLASFWPVADGAAFISKSPMYRDPIKMRSEPASLGKDRYGWTDFAELVLAAMPTGFTAADVDPAARAATHHGRMLLLWRPTSPRITWVLDPLRGSMDRDIGRINRQFERDWKQDRSRPDPFALVIRGDLNIASNVGVAAVGAHARADHVTVKGSPSRASPNGAGSNPWISGSFYVSLLLTVTALVLGITRAIPLVAFPAVFAATLLLFVAVGLFVLIQEGKIRENSFVSLMTQILKLVPPFNRLLQEPRKQDGA
jgi:hypothetical protein